MFSKTHDHSAGGTLAVKPALIRRLPVASAPCGPSTMEVVASPFSAWSSLSQRDSLQSETEIRTREEDQRGAVAQWKNAPPAGRRRTGTDLQADVAEDVFYRCAHRLNTSTESSPVLWGIFRRKKSSILSEFCVQSLRFSRHFHFLWTAARYEICFVWDAEDVLFPFNLKPLETHRIICWNVDYFIKVDSVCFCSRTSEDLKMWNLWIVCSCSPENASQSRLTNRLNWIFIGGVKGSPLPSEDATVRLLCIVFFFFIRFVSIVREIWQQKEERSSQCLSALFPPRFDWK